MTQTSESLLEIRGKCLYGPEQRIPLQRAALARGIERLPLYAEHDKELLLVCSGPNVKGEVETIRKLHDEGHPILAVKGAHDFLYDNGIAPEMAIAVDPQPHTVKYFQRHSDETLYILASQCPVELFDLLSGHRMRLFHCAGDTTRKVLKEWAETSTTAEEHITVAGGSSSGLRSFNVAYLLGFRMLHIFGMDSSLQPDGQRKVNGEYHTDDKPTLKVMVGERTFDTCAAFAAQASEFQEIIDRLPDLKLRCYGDGLIPEISRHRARTTECKQCLL